MNFKRNNTEKIMNSVIHNCLSHLVMVSWDGQAHSKVSTWQVIEHLRTD